jgi:hypothetical protein
MSVSEVFLFSSLFKFDDVKDSKLYFIGFKFDQYGLINEKAFEINYMYDSAVLFQDFNITLFRLKNLFIQLKKCVRMQLEISNFHLHDITDFANGISVELYQDTKDNMLNYLINVNDIKLKDVTFPHFIRVFFPDVEDFEKSGITGNARH